MRSLLVVLMAGVCFSSAVWAADKKQKAEQDDPYLLMDLLGI